MKNAKLPIIYSSSSTYIHYYSSTILLYTCFDNIAVVQILIFGGALLQILGMQKQASGCIAGRNSLVMLEVEQNQETLKKYVNSPVFSERRKRTKTTLCIACFI